MHQARTHVVRTQWEQNEDTGLVEVIAATRTAPPVLNWAVAAETTFRFSGRDVSISVRARADGLNRPETVARFGLQLGLAGVDRVRWFGRGPGESYCDKKEAQRFGNWEDSVDGLFVDYEYPQDGGNRTDVRWVEFLGDGEEGDEDQKGGGAAAARLLRARFGHLEGASFQAMHYTTKDLDETAHPYELRRRKRKDTVVHLDWAHHGLGSGSCGPATLPPYELRTDQEFEYEVLLD